MITKDEFLELVIDIMNGGAAPDHAKYHPAVVGKFIDLALNSFIASSANEALALNEYTINNGWIKPHNNIKIRWDQIRGMAYINLPVKPILLRYNRGIREITWPQSDGTPSFLITETSAWQVLSQLEISDLMPGQFHACVEAQRVYFPKMNKLLVGKKLTVKMISGIQSYGGNDILPLEESKAVEIASATLNIMNVQKSNPVKVLNNSNPNTP